MFLNLKTKLIAILGGVLGLIGVIAAAFLKGRKSKEKETKAETAENVIHINQRAKDIEKDNADAGAKSRRDRLRDYASDSE